MADLIRDQIIAGHVDNFMKQEAEIARLRAEVEVERNAGAQPLADAIRLQEMYHAENERLREVLQWMLDRWKPFCVDGEDRVMVDKGRAALAGDGKV